MVASRLYGEEIYSKVLCRFYTAVYVQEDVEDISFTCSDSTIMYINGNKIESNTIKFNTGWNIIELYKGIEPVNQSDYIEVYFHVEVPRSEENGMILYTHLTSDLMNEYAQPGENLNYISIMNPQSMNIDYTRIVSAERSMTTEAIIDRMSETFVKSDPYKTDKEIIEQNISSVEQKVDSVTTRVTNLETTSEGHNTRLGALEVTANNITAKVESLEVSSGQHSKKLADLEVTADGITGRVESLEDSSEQHSEKLTNLETTADGINASITEVNKNISDMGDEFNKKLAEINASVEEVEFKFGTSSGNNYFTNSGFLTDNPQTNYIYTTSKTGEFKYLDGEYRENDLFNTVNIITNTITLNSEPSTSFSVLNIADENRESEYRSIRCDGFFSLSQTIMEKDIFPPIDYNSPNQLYMSVNTKLLEKVGFENIYLNFFVIVETINKKQFIYNSHEAMKVTGDPATMSYHALGDCMFEYNRNQSETRTEFNIFPSNKSNSIGNFIYKNVNPISENWEKQSVFINLKGITETQNYTRDDIVKVSFGFNTFTKDQAASATGNKLSIALNEPFICITKDNVEHPYSQNPNEIFSGSTKINYDGIEVSKNTSPIKTKIRNTGMSIYNNDTQLAYFESDAYVPVLKVDEVISDGVATKDYKFSSTVQEIKVGVPDNDNLPEGEEPVIVDFTSLRAAFDSLPDFIDTDYLVIRVYGNVIIDRYTSLKNKKCGIIEILLEPEANIAGYPLLISNIDGVVRIRSYQEKYNYIDKTITKDFGNIGYCLFCHNIRHLEISAVNFSREKVEDNNGKLENFDFPFNYIYQYKYSTGKVGALTELIDILKYSGIFIGYCNLVDINRCSFGAIEWRKNDFGEIETSNFLKYGIVGDHSDCYLFNNKGSLLEYYYVNREKCWYRLPVKSNVEDSDWEHVYGPSLADPNNPDNPGVLETPAGGGIGNAIDGNTGNKIEQSTGTNTSGTNATISKPSDSYNPPYKPSDKDESVKPNTYYAAFRTDKDSDKDSDKDYSFRNFESTSLENMYIGPLNFSKSLIGKYREKDGTYDPASYTDYDNFAINGYKPYGCEFIIDNNDIADSLNRAYSISSIDLHLKISKTSYAPDSFTTKPLKFYVKLLLSNTGSVIGEDGRYWFKALHYTDYTIELDSKGISAYAWSFQDSGSVGDFKLKDRPSPFTIWPGSGFEELNIRLDNISFSTEWKKSIDDTYDERKKTIGFNENDYLHPDIFTNIEEAFKQGKVVAIQIYPDKAKGQCFKVKDCYIKLNYKK